MSLIKRKKRSDSEELAEATSSTNLYKADHDRIEQLRKKANKKQSEFLRDFVRQALIQDGLSSRQSSDVQTANQPALESLLKDGLAPIFQELVDLKGCMQELALMRANETTSPDPALIQEINRCLVLIDENGAKRHTDFIRNLKIVFDRVEQVERWSEAAYVLAGHSFNSTLALLDLFRRFVLIPQLAAMDPQCDAAKESVTEIEASTAAAAAKRKNVERRLKLPNNSKVKFLSNQLPKTKRDAA